MAPKNDETTKLSLELGDLKRSIAQRIDDMETARKAVGDLNGPYALLFKVNMIALPLALGSLIAFGVWINLQFRDQAVLNASTKEWMHSWVGYPRDSELLKLQIAERIAVKTDAQYSQLLAELSRLRDEVRDIRQSPNP